MNRFNNYVDKNSIELFIDEIEKNIESKNYLSALHLALSIPDMLGKIAYPELHKNKPYIKWFDTYVRSNIFGLLYSDEFYASTGCPRICGKVCYALRCKLFHEGTNDLLQKTNINEFVISMSDDDFLTGDVAGKDYEFRKYNPETGEVPEVNYLYISCKILCKDIVASAKEFVKSNPNLNYPKLRMNNGGGRINECWFIGF